jgi:hypothetical protein
MDQETKNKKITCKDIEEEEEEEVSEKWREIAMSDNEN